MARKLAINPTIPIEVQRSLKQLTKWAQEDEGHIESMKDANGSSGSSAGPAVQSAQRAQVTDLLSSKLNTLVNFRGTWNSTTAYVVNDLVVLSGRGFIALKPSTNIATTNAAYWAGL